MKEIVAFIIELSVLLSAFAFFILLFIFMQSEIDSTNPCSTFSKSPSSCDARQF